MAAGFVTASLTDTATAFGLPNTSPNYVEPSLQFINIVKLIFPAVAGVLVLPPVLLKQLKSKQEDPNPSVNGALLAEWFTGAVFGVGLGLSGMTLPTKVAAFLSVLHPSFDPSLMFVMGAALLVALPCFQFIIKSSKLTTPVCGGELSLPTNTKIDMKLLLGGVLFGMGWGISGMCPGPAVANLVNPSVPLLSYMGGLGVGFLADHFFANPVWSMLSK